MDIKEVAKWLRANAQAYEEAREYNRKHENRQSMLRANAQAEEMSAMAEACGRFTWRPIETAPRDGLPRLYLCNGRIVQGFVDATGLLTVQDECGWRAMRRNPTHWMPLPEAPQP